MKKITRKIKCACCGHETEMEVNVSRNVNQAGLDGRPQYEWQLRPYQECPKCHYVSWDISRKNGEDVATLVSSDKYRKVLDSNTNQSRYYEAMLLLVANQEDSLNVILQYLWWTEFTGDSQGTQVRERAISLLKTIIDTKPLATYVFTYIDLLRRNSEFDKAADILNDVSSSMEKNKEDNKLLYQIYQYERRLIEAKDTAPHLVSEVVV